jgi:NTE family protein
MVAFVLSGGGNLGALQIGALQVLMAEGILPEMLVGTSAGAVNAAFLASDPTLEGAKQLAEIWKRIRKENIYPGGPLSMAMHMATQQDSLCTRKNLAAFLQRHTPEGVRTFRDMKIPLYIIATDLLTGHRYLFGDDPNEHVVDAILASTAIPPVFPPWFYQGRMLVDGGVSDNLPIDVAVEKEATEIYALDILRDGPMDDGHWNVMEVATLSIMGLIAQQRNRDLDVYSSIPGLTLHYLPLCASRPLTFDDFNHATELIENGRESARAYLSELETIKARKKITPSKENAIPILGNLRDFLTTLVSQFRLSSQS